MPTKQELEDELNNKLDLDLQWSEMKKGDLLTIRDGLEDQDFVKKFIAVYANMVAGDKVEGQIKDWEPGSGIEMLAALQRDEMNPADLFM